MVYEIKSPLLGFENIKEVRFELVDETFAKLYDTGDSNIALSLVSPYNLREYSFDVPMYFQALLDIKKDTNLKVYNIFILQTPLEHSKVNFLAPVVFNEDNHTAGQLALASKKYPDFGYAEELSSFIKTNEG